MKQLRRSLVIVEPFILHGLPRADALVPNSARHPPVS